MEARMREGREATYADVLAAPDHMVAELIDGHLHMSPRRAPPEAVAASYIGTDLIGGFGRRGGCGSGGGWWILDEPELHLGARVLVPDLAGWRRERMPTMPPTAAFTLAPDWICEVVSPSTAWLDLVHKRRIYAEEGVSHLWLVDPRRRLLEVLRLAGEHWLLVETFAGDGRVRAEPFEAAELDLSEWWLPEATPDAGDAPPGA